MPRVRPWTIFAFAVLTGYTAFDFDLDMRIRTRDTLFALHRLCGLGVGILLVAWGVFRWHVLVRRILRVKLTPLVGLYHTPLGFLCLLVPIPPWFARSLDGRASELYALWPTFNLVSHPTTPLAYQLLHQHKLLVSGVLVPLGLYIVGTLFHRFVLRDETLSAMSFRRT